MSLMADAGTEGLSVAISNVNQPIMNEAPGRFLAAYQPFSSGRLQVSAIDDATAQQNILIPAQETKEILRIPFNTKMNTNDFVEKNPTIGFTTERDLIKRQMDIYLKDDYLKDTERRTGLQPIGPKSFMNEQPFDAAERIIGLSNSLSNSYQPFLFASDIEIAAYRVNAEQNSNVRDRSIGVNELNRRSLILNQQEQRVQLGKLDKPVADTFFTAQTSRDPTLGIIRSEPTVNDRRLIRQLGVI